MDNASQQIQVMDSGSDLTVAVRGYQAKKTGHGQMKVMDKYRLCTHVMDSQQIQVMDLAVAVRGCQARLPVSRFNTSQQIQGYLAHKKPPPPLGPP